MVTRNCGKLAYTECHKHRITARRSNAFAGDSLKASLRLSTIKAIAPHATAELMRLQISVLFFCHFLYIYVCMFPLVFIVPPVFGLALALCYFHVHTFFLACFLPLYLFYWCTYHVCILLI